MINTPTLLGLTSIVLAGTMMNAEAITIAHGGNSVDIDFVDIGNAGNTGQTYTDSIFQPNNQTYTHGAVAYDYKIGKFEITADQWAAVIAADSVVGNAGSWSGSQPTAGISWYEAAKFANWLTSGDALQGAYTFSGTSGADNTFTGVDRASALTTYGTIYVLPTEDEWYKAAYFKSDGSGYTTYATGNASGDGISFSGDTSYDSVFSSGFDSAAPLAVGGGTIENNGTYDMGGNVDEWNESAFDGTLDVPSERRVVRGGDWIGSPLGLQSSSRGGNTPDIDYNSRGFRVASISVVPEPSSVGLLVIGATGLMLRRKRS
jgi:sulfatase modifying factor 1